MILDIFKEITMQAFVLLAIIKPIQMSDAHGKGARSTLVWNMKHGKKNLDLLYFVYFHLKV